MTRIGSVGSTWEAYTAAATTFDEGEGEGEAGGDHRVWPVVLDPLDGEGGEGGEETEGLEGEQGEESEDEEEEAEEEEAEGRGGGRARVPSSLTQGPSLFADLGTDYGPTPPFQSL